MTIVIILPRQGEVAPKATEGEGGDALSGRPAVRLLRQATPATSPWRGRIVKIDAGYSFAFSAAASDATALPRRAGLGCESSGAQPIR